MLNPSQVGTRLRSLEPSKQWIHTWPARVSQPGKREECSHATYHEYVLYLPRKSDVHHGNIPTNEHLRLYTQYFV